MIHTDVEDAGSARLTERGKFDGGSLEGAVIRDTEQEEVRIPLAAETVTVDKKVVETGRVRVRTEVDTREHWVREDVVHDSVEIVRIPFDKQVEVAPPDRVEGDTMIVSIVEEVIVVERRLMLREEVHMRHVRSTSPIEQAVTLRSMRAVVERTGATETAVEHD